MKVNVMNIDVYLDYNDGIQLSGCREDCRKEDWGKFTMHICDLVGIDVEWSYRVNTFVSTYSNFHDVHIDLKYNFHNR